MTASDAGSGLVANHQYRQLSAQDLSLVEWVIRGVKEYAKYPDESLLYVVNTLYHLFLEKCDAVEREKVFNTVLEEVKSGRVRAGALLPFMEFEPHRRVASTAVREYVLNCPVEPDDQFAAVRDVFDLIRTDRTGNRGAVFAGLVLLGDRRINGIARSARGSLKLQDIQNFSHTHVDYMTAATVEFYLEWLLRLNQPDTQQEFRVVANGLNLMIIHDQTGLVIEMQQNLGAYGFMSDSTVLQRKPFEDYFNDVLPMMKHIAERSPQPDIINNVIQIWQGYCEEAPSLREQSTRNLAQNHRS